MTSSIVWSLKDAATLREALNRHGTDVLAHHVAWNIQDPPRGGGPSDAFRCLAWIVFEDGAQRRGGRPWSTLNQSDDTIDGRAMRTPCSCPMGFPKSTFQISPHFGGIAYSSPRESGERAFEHRALSQFLAPLYRRPREVSRSPLVVDAITSRMNASSSSRSAITSLGRSSTPSSRTSNSTIAPSSNCACLRTSAGIVT